MYVHVHLFSGTRFASGGTDRTVIIWNAESIEAILKYTHIDSIQCLSYSPVSQQLLSCTASDIGKSCNVCTMCQCVLHIHVNNYTYILVIDIQLGSCYNVHVYTCKCAFIAVLVLLEEGRTQNLSIY